MIPANMYVRQMLVRDHRQALSRESRVPAWERRDAALRESRARGRRGRLRLLVFRPRTPRRAGSARARSGRVGAPSAGAGTSVLESTTNRVDVLGLVLRMNVDLDCTTEQVERCIRNRRRDRAARALLGRDASRTQREDRECGARTALWRGRLPRLVPRGNSGRTRTMSRRTRRTFRCHLSRRALSEVPRRGASRQPARSVQHVPSCKREALAAAGAAPGLPPPGARCSGIHRRILRKRRSATERARRIVCVECGFVSRAIVGHDDAALACADELRELGRESGGAPERADGSALERHAGRLACVLDDHEPVLACARDAERPSRTTFLACGQEARQPSSM